jgi:hypothetical protein
MRARLPAPSMHAFNATARAPLVRQLVYQFPRAFEYGSHALAILATHGYAAFTATFRHNTRQELEADPVARGATSLWQQLLSQRAHLVHQGFSPWELSRGPLPAVCTMERLRVWELHLPPACVCVPQQIAEVGWCQAAHATHSVAGAALAEGRNTVEDAAERPDAEGSGAARGALGSLRRLGAAQVTHATLVADPARSNYTAYNIEVQVETAEASASGAGSTDDENDATPAKPSVRVRRLERRYTDFQRLDASIRAAGLPSEAIQHLPALPTTFTLNKFSDAVVRTRCVKLNQYVQALLSAGMQDQSVAELPAVQAFFE